MCCEKTYEYINEVNNISCQEKFRTKLIGGKLLYNVKTPNGWSIVIMPDNILIDNCHTGKAHIHPDPDNHVIKLEI